MGIEHDLTFPHLEFPIKTHGLYELGISYFFSVTYYFRLIAIVVLKSLCRISYYYSCYFVFIRFYLSYVIVNNFYR